MTLATYNRYVDNATGVSKTGHGCAPHGEARVGEPVLYWKEDLMTKKVRGRHAKDGRAFFLRRLRIPRKHSLFHKLVRLFGIR